MNKYLNLIAKKTEYADRMNRLSRRIFGEVVRNTNKTSMKVVKMFSENPYYKDNFVINYYPRHKQTQELMSKLRAYGLYRDEYEDFKEEMDRRRRLRGKIPWPERRRNK